MIILVKIIGLELDNTLIYQLLFRKTTLAQTNITLFDTNTFESYNLDALKHINMRRTFFTYATNCTYILVKKR